MSKRKTTQLPAANTLSGAEVIRITQEGVEKKATLNLLETGIEHPLLTVNELAPDEDGNVTLTPAIIGITVNGQEADEETGNILLNAEDIDFSGIPTYADEAAAVTGELETGKVYKTAAGALRVKL